MDAPEQLTEYPVIALTILAAIPVVSFALWAEYWGRYLAELRREAPGDLKRSLELRKIRWAGIYVFFTQALFYLSCAPLRADRSTLAAGIFMVSVLIQSRIQAGLERKVNEPLARELLNGRASSAPTESPGAQARSGLAAFAWTLLTATGYLASVWGCAAVAAGIGKLAGASKELLGICMLGGALVGIFVGVGVIFAMGAVHLRRLLPAARLSDVTRRAMFEDCFARAGVRAPEFWVVELSAGRFTNAMMAGFARGRGWFRPGLFVSRSLLEAFPDDELRAVVLHEASHSCLGHLRRRFLGTIVAVLGTSFVLTGVLVVAHKFLPAEMAGPVRVMLTILSVLAPLWLLRAQGERHELEADAHAVLALGAGFEAFASALRRMDGMNGADGKLKDPRSYLSPSSAHPATERRLMLLARRIEEQARGARRGKMRKAA